MSIWRMCCPVWVFNLRSSRLALYVLLIVDLAAFHYLPGVQSISVALRAAAFAICLSSKLGLMGAHVRLIQFPRPRNFCIAS
jgi:hypothetical protein